MIGSDGIEIRKMYIKYIYVINEVSHFAFQYLIHFVFQLK